MHTAISITLRVVQLISAIIILVLTSLLLTDQNDYRDSKISAAIYYAIATGAATFVFGALACADLGREFLPGLASLGCDVLVAGMNVAGGILLAVKLDGASCENTDYTYREQRLMKIDILAGDCYNDDLSYRCSGADEGDYFLNRRCRWATIVATFMFVAAVVSIVGALMGGLRRRAGMGGK